MSRRSLFHALAVAIMAAMLHGRAWAESLALAVIYPDVEEPYLSIFLQIIEGVKDKAKGEVVQYPVKGDVDTNALNTWLRTRSVKRAILLGRQGIKLAGAIDPSIRVALGGAVLSPNADAPSLSGISLAPDPERLFLVLKQLSPSLKRVIVVFNPAQNRWLIDQARESATRLGLTLVTREAKDVRAAAVEYQDIMSKAQGKQDALWLPQDSSTVNEEFIVPMLLKEAWEKNLIVFSSTFVHVKKGVLFALYPDNKGWGRELADLAYTVTPGIQALKSLKVAINVRTASHLGFNLDPTRFDTVFPEP